MVKDFRLDFWHNFQAHLRAYAKKVLRYLPIWQERETRVFHKIAELDGS